MGSSGSRLHIRDGIVVTMEPGSAPEAADILVEEGRIAAVGAIGPVADAEVLDAKGRIVLPGLIDSHVHTWQTALRGIAADWTVPQYMRAMHRGLATRFRPDDIRIANLMGALAKLDAGVTTLVDWCHNNPTPDHTDAAIDGLEASGARALFLHGSPKPDPGPGQKHFSEVPMPRDEVERLRAGRFASGDRLVTLGLAVLGPQYGVHDVCVADYALARELDLIVSTHTGGAPLLSPNTFEALIEAGMIDGRCNIVHANNFAPDLARALVEAGANFTVTAEVEMQMGFGDPLTGVLRDLGALITIGADVEPAAAGDMFTAMRTTLNVQRNIDNKALLARGQPLPDTASITCREALEWVTVNGAAMTRMSDRIGTLAPGKEADIVLLRATDANLFPVRDPIGAVVRQAGPGNVETVLVGGRFVKRDGRLLHPGLDEKRDALMTSGTRILEEIELSPGGPN